MAANQIQQILVKRGNTASISSYTGPLGELVLNTQTNQLVAQDGVTPGGRLVTGDTFPIVANLTVLQREVANIAGISGNVAQLQSFFANVNLEGISTTIANLQLAANSSYGNANAAAYLPIYGGTVGTNLINFTNSNGQIESGETTGQPNSSWIEMTANIQHDIAGFYAAENGSAQVYSAQDVLLFSNTIGSTAPLWTFDRTGNLNLPGTTGRILFPYNENSNAIIDYSQDIGQFFVIQNNFVDGHQGINLDTDDAQVQISSKNSGGYPLRTWNFDWQGQLTYPDSTIQITAYQGPAGQTSFATQANVITANTSMKGYVDNQITLLVNNAPAILDTLGQIAANLQTDESSLTRVILGQAAANTQISALQANVGSYYIWANANTAGLYNSIVGANTAWTANAATQQGLITALQANTGGLYNSIAGANSTIQALSANVGSFYTWANTNFGTSSYANANVAAYIAGNVTIGNATATSFRSNNFLYPNGVSILTGIGGTYSNTNVTAYLAGNISTGNVRLSSGSWLDFINSDLNWRIGYNLGSYTKTTAQTTVDVVVGSGTVGPDGFTVGQTNGASIFELVGYTRNAWFANNVTTVGNVTGGNVLATGFFYANGTPFTSSNYGNTQVAAYLVANPPAGTYSNSNVAAYLTTQTFYSNSNVAAYLVANPQGSTYSNANVVANLSNYVTNIVSTANITANYFIGNGAALSSLTYASIGNIYGSSSNVTLQAGNYNWTFDNTGNLSIPTNGNIIWANGTVFSSGTGGSGSSGTLYTNANVVSMLAANTYIAFGNVVTTYPTLANITSIFVGNNTTIATGSASAPSATHILNNAYFGANGAMYARNTYASGIGQFYIDGGNFYWNAQASSTANVVAGLGSRMSLTGTTLATLNGTVFNSAGLITAAGGISVTSSAGITTNQASIPLFNTATTTTLGSSGILLGTAGLLQVGPASGQYTVGNVIVGQANIATGNNSLTIRSQGTYNSCIVTASNGGWNTGPFTNMATSGGSGTGMTVTVNSTQGGYVNTNVYNALVVNNPGTGYKNGDVITCLGGGGCTFVIYNYNPNISNSTTTAIATYQFGIDGNLTLPGNVTLASNAVVAGDFSNSTFNYRTVFRTTTANATTGIYAVPSGTGTGAAWQAANSSNIANTSKIMITTNGSTDVQLVSGINGTGTYLPLSFLTNGSTQMQLDTAGNLLMVTGGNISTTGNVIAGNIVANQYGNSVGTTATYSGNVTAAYFVGNIVNNSGTTNLVGNVATGNLTVTGNLISTGYGFFPGAYSEASTSAGVFVGNTGTGTPSPRIGLYNGVTSQNWQIDNYGGTFRWFTPGVTQMQLDAGGNLTVVNGNATVAGNVTISGNAGVIQSNRTAFRVYGQGGSVGLNANLVASNWTVDYTQGFAGTALNGTTGIFTAPIAGLYSTTLTARTTSNTNSSGIQAVIQQRKAGITSVACMIEWAPNTTFNHATGSTVVKLAQGDQLWVQCLANGGGTGFSFDGNDHWDVTYLG